jgi:hypothetical protein
LWWGLDHRQVDGRLIPNEDERLLDTQNVKKVPALEKKKTKRPREAEAKTFPEESDTWFPINT